ncbi:MAG: exodeoxyribonuclease VII large subunit, partial [Clostridia bacterium]|nr:exodeoxyribonuclease VII large subunit [Clostridia bacterium]
MDRALTVTQVGTYIKQIFDAEEMLSYIRVIGEISGLSISKGVAYFVLKDENAQLQCVCFSPEKFSFNNGDKVYATGTPKYYVKGGKLNFNVSKIEQAGLGELYINFLMLKQKLELLGYFDAANKKPIPKNIKRIGVVTSAEGAVIQDIINVRNRRNKNVDIVLYPVKVQGVGAEYEIKKGIEFFDNYDVDVVVVARGGGSLEDLMPFNTEVVAKAVFYANKPIVSAVGHETDFTICDFVADLRAPTPSVASELLCEDIQAKKQNVLSLLKRLNLAVIKNFRDNSVFVTKIYTTKKCLPKRSKPTRIL